jgi:hypothetical protein
MSDDVLVTYPVWGQSIAFTAVTLDTQLAARAGHRTAADLLARVRELGLECDCSSASAMAWKSPSVAYGRPLRMSREALDLLCAVDEEFRRAIEDGTLAVREMS